MSPQTFARLLCVGASLFVGCNKPEKAADTAGPAIDKCSTHTPCSAGYKCNYGTANPSDSHAIGECDYQTCGLTDQCKKPQACIPGKETANCDKFDNDKFCGCVSPTSQDVPADPPTTGSPTTTGDKP